MPGADTFRDAITTFRNRSIHTYVGHCLQFRGQLLQFGEFGQESGWSDAINHFITENLLRLDLLRRKITRNPLKADLKDLTEAAKQLSLKVPDQVDGLPDVSVTRDDVPRATGPEMELRYALDGTDPNIPLLNSERLNDNLKNADARMLVAALDLHLCEATRLDSRHATYRITTYESLMLYDSLADMLEICVSFGGDAKRLPVPHGVRPSEEPRGPSASPNREAGEAAS